MIDHNWLSPDRSNNNARRQPVVRLPVKLYKSNSTIFELYDGGRTYRSMAIRWEHLESIEGMDTEPPHRSLHEHPPEIPPQAGG